MFKYQVFFALLLIGLISCKKQVFEGYHGEWSLINYQPSAEFDNSTNFNKGDIVWDFDTISQKVIISIKSGVDFSRIESGNYDYQFGDNGCNYGPNRFISMGGKGLGVLIVDDVISNNLWITNACVDGGIMSFVR